MKNVLSLTPGSISIISDKRELAGMGEIRMEEKRHSFFVKNTNLFVGVDFIYKHTHTHPHTFYGVFLLIYMQIRNLVCIPTL